MVHLIDILKQSLTKWPKLHPSLSRFIHIFNKKFNFLCFKPLFKIRMWKCVKSLTLCLLLWLLAVRGWHWSALMWEPKCDLTREKAPNSRLHAFLRVTVIQKYYCLKLWRVVRFLQNLWRRFLFVERTWTSERLKRILTKSRKKTTRWDGNGYTTS